MALASENESWPTTPSHWPPRSPPHSPLIDLTRPGTSTGISSSSASPFANASSGRFPHLSSAPLTTTTATASPSSGTKSGKPGRRRRLRSRQDLALTNVRMLQDTSAGSSIRALRDGGSATAPAGGGAGRRRRRRPGGGAAVSPTDSEVRAAAEQTRAAAGEPPDVDFFAKALALEDLAVVRPHTVGGAGGDGTGRRRRRRKKQDGDGDGGAPRMTLAESAAASAAKEAAKVAAMEAERLAAMPKKGEAKPRKKKKEKKPAWDEHTRKINYFRNTFCLFCGKGPFKFDCGCRWLHPLTVIDNKLIALRWKLKFLSLDLTEQEVEKIEAKIEELIESKKTVDLSPLHDKGCDKHDHVLNFRQCHGRCPKCKGCTMGDACDHFNPSGGPKHPNADNTASIPPCNCEEVERIQREQEEQEQAEKQAKRERIRLKKKAARERAERKKPKAPKLRPKLAGGGDGGGGGGGGDGEAGGAGGSGGGVAGEDDSGGRHIGPSKPW